GCDVDPTGRYLMMIGALFVLGAGGEVIFARTQIPDVVWLILAGVSLRVTGLIDPTVLDPILPLFSTLTLIVVLFDGGRQIVIHDLVKAAPRASALAILTFLGAMICVAVVLQLAALTGLLPDSWTFLHSLMVGAILGGSSSLVIMPSMAVAKVEPKISNLVGLESALTDALCVVVAVVLMNLIQSGNASGTDAVLELGENFGLALLIGLIAGWAWMPVLRALSGSQHSYPITLAALLFLTVMVGSVGGNAAMAVLTFSVVVGNADALMKMVGFSLGDKPLKLDDTVVTVHTQVAFIIKSFFFTYIGLMLAPPWSLLLLGIVVGFTLFGSRIPATMLIARAPAFNHYERKLVTVALPRGMAAGVLATMPAAAGVEGTEQLPAMVFAAVVTSIAIFAVGFRKVRTEAGASAGATTVEQQPTSAVAVATQAMPDGLLPDDAVVASLPAPVVEPSAPQAHPPVAGDLMLDGQPSAPAPAPVPRTATAYGIAPAVAEPPKPAEAETPTSPGIALKTLHGIPAPTKGPPPPDARPVMGGAFVPTRPEPPKDPVE
ncbi:MAG TPA: cation:proton antiporter, partial [Enhygromyxa sp.]|nr:cation:proton antiporter [Enhygromyxa sp.]